MQGNYDFSLLHYGGVVHVVSNHRQLDWLLKKCQANIKENIKAPMTVEGPVMRKAFSCHAVMMDLVVSTVSGDGDRQLTYFTNPIMQLFHIPQCNIQNRNVHIDPLMLWTTSLYMRGFVLICVYL